MRAIPSIDDPEKDALYFGQKGKILEYVVPESVAPPEEMDPEPAK